MTIEEHFFELERKLEDIRKELDKRPVSKIGEAVNIPSITGTVRVFDWEQELRDNVKITEDEFAETWDLDEIVEFIKGLLK